MKKNIFFCIAAQKSGTTSLHDILVQNNKLALPKQKESHFFSVPELYSNGLEYYFNYFFNKKDIEQAQLIGEVDPSYSFFEGTAKRIHETLNNDYNIKFIFILRDPVKRAYSQYLMSRRRGYEDLDFFDAIEIEKNRISQDSFSFINHSYLERGYYSKQINEYLKYFPKENFLFVRFEDDFIKSKEQAVQQISTFLNLEPYDYDYNLKSNPASEPKSVFLRDLMFKDNKLKSFLSKTIPSSKLKSKLKDRVTKINLKEAQPIKLSQEQLYSLYSTYFVEEINTLEEMLGLDLSLWKHNK